MGNRAVGCIMGARLASKSGEVTDPPLLGSATAGPNLSGLIPLSGLVEFGERTQGDRRWVIYSSSSDCEADWTCHSS